MSAYRTFVVANPRAGAGQVEREWDRIERMLQARLPEIDFAFTEGPNHATLLTREALREGWEMIVTIGGDGTFNETANGFFEKVKDDAFVRDSDGSIRQVTEQPLVPVNPDAAFGMLPMGTGGDFRKTVGINGELQENIDRLAGDETMDSDIGLLTYIDHDGQLASRAFVNIASCGFSGKVDKVVNNMWKGFGGPASFRIGSTMAWLGWRNQPLEVRLDGGPPIEGDFFMAVVANGQYFGGGMWVAPQARIDDGSFEVVLLRDISKLESATLMTKIYEGKHFDYEEAFRYEARTVSIVSPGSDPVLIDLDGEQPGRVPALFTMQEQALQLKV